MMIYQNFYQKLFLSFIVLLLTSCALLEKDHELSAELKQLKQDYHAHLSKVCVKDEVYDGLRNAFHYVVCPLDTTTLTFQLEMNKIYFLWDDATYLDKKQEMQKNMSKETQVFLSFYTPDTKLDDLSAKSSNWRAFLDSNGKRYLASIQKMKNRYEDLKVLYPAHSPWSTGYLLTFPVRLEQIDFNNADFTLTGRVGFSKKSFSK